jgi:copper chaperone CopZ
MATKTVTAPAISCGHCVMTIEREVGEMPGVTAVRADAATRQVAVEWDEKRTNWTAIRDLLVEINYPPVES